MPPKLTKAIFPVAGLGTRFLPATKSVPKEIMTLVDRPLIQYAIEEAREAGITDFIFVTSRRKSALENYFDRAPELEASLREKGKHDLLRILETTNMKSGDIAYVRQDQPLGLGHAVHCASRLLGDEPFAVILPDDVFQTSPGCLKQMVAAYEEIGGNLVATMEVDPSMVSHYGIMGVEATDQPWMRVHTMVEKPDPALAPSNLAIIGRYILTPAVMDNLSKLTKGAAEEIQLTDAIAAEIKRTNNVHAYKFHGARFDCGSKAGFLKATVAFGLARSDLKDELEAYLKTFFADPKAK